MREPWGPGGTGENGGTPSTGAATAGHVSRAILGPLPQGPLSSMYHMSKKSPVNPEKHVK